MAPAQSELADLRSFPDLDVEKIEIDSRFSSMAPLFANLNASVIEIPLQLRNDYQIGPRRNHRKEFGSSKFNHGIS